MKKTIQFILTIFAAVMSVVAVVLGIINLARSERYVIYGAYDIGLNNFFYDDMTAMYVDEGHNPYLRGDFYDESVLTEFSNILSSATFQQGEKYESSSDELGGGSSWITFTSERATYCFSLQGGTLEVSIGDETYYYYTNAYHSISNMIYQTALSKFSE